MSQSRLRRFGAIALAAGYAAAQEAQVPNVVLEDKWMKAVPPVIELWAAPGELHLDPLTGKPQNPFVAGRDFRKGNAVWDAGKKTVKLAAARNEVLGFQLLVEAAGEDLRYVKVQASELKAQSGPAAIAANAFQLFRVWYTEVTEPSRTFPGGGFNALGLPSTGAGLYGDALIPFRVRGWGAPFAVPLGRNQSVWVDLKVPKGLPAGEYAGTIEVAADRAAPASVTVELTVWDFELPDKPTARAEAPLYRATIPGAFGKPEIAEKIERQFFRMAREHRFSAYIYDTWPDLKPGGAEEEVHIDWTSYDKRFGPYLDGSAFDDKQPMDQWYVAIDMRWPGPAEWSNSKPDVFYGRIEKAIRAYDEHFREKGWAPKCMYVFFQGLDEPSREDQFVKIKKVAEAVHRGSKRIKMRHDFYTAFAKPEALLQRFGDVMDIWNISGCFYPVKELQAEQARGKEAWFYQGSEPWIGGEDIDNDALGLRTWAWIGWKYRVDCWHNWCSGRWSSENILLYPNNGGSRQWWRPNSNGVMLYPGSPLGVDELLPSVRLKAYRRGNTDYEYFAMLKNMGKGDVADAIVNSIVRSALGDARQKEIGDWGDWSHDVDQWESARARLAAAIVAGRRK